jgi:hypothetical protein
MQTDKPFINFNTNKTIQELQDNMFSHIEKLEGYMLENSFYEFLLGEPMYKPNKMNLIESFEELIKKIGIVNKKSEHLISEVNLHVNQIYKKIECEDLYCDNFFIENHNRLECKIKALDLEYAAIKTQMFSYLKKVN